MSTRRVPRTLDERVAALEEYVRRGLGDQAVIPTDVRYLYNARGDILIGLGTANPQVLALPAVSPPASGVVVPRYNPGTALGVEWVAIDAPGMTSAAV